MEVAKCDWLGTRGPCGRPVAKSSADRCSAHKDKPQRRLCAYDRCQVRVADVEGMMCYRHRQVEMARAERSATPARSRGVSDDFADDEVRGEVKAVRVPKKAAAPAAAAAAEKPAPAAKEPPPKKPVRRDNLLSASTADLRELKKRLAQLSLSSSGSSSEDASGESS